MSAFVGFWDIIDFSLSRAFSQEIFGFLEFLTRGMKNSINICYTSGEKLPPYLRLPEKAITYSVAIKVGK